MPDVNAVDDGSFEPLAGRLIERAAPSRRGVVVVGGGGCAGCGGVFLKGARETNPPPVLVFLVALVEIGQRRVRRGPFLVLSLFRYRSSRLFFLLLPKTIVRQLFYFVVCVCGTAKAGERGEGGGFKGGKNRKGGSG